MKAICIDNSFRCEHESDPSLLEEGKTYEVSYWGSAICDGCGMFLAACAVEELPDEAYQQDRFIPVQESEILTTKNKIYETRTVRQSKSD